MCEQCLYRANCQFLAKHKPSNIKGCTAFKSEKELIADTVKEIFDRVKAVMFLYLYEHKPFNSGEYVQYFGIDLGQAIDDLREKVEAYYEVQE